MGQDRRRFLKRLVLGMGSLTGAILALPFVVSLLEPFFKKKGPVWRTVATWDSLKIGETKKVSFQNASTYSWGKKISTSAAYLRREENNKLNAFSVNCSHLGCPVRWEETPQMFFCPCHGGAFYKDGSRAAGPPNRGLYQYGVRIKDGKVQLRTGAIPITNINV